MNAEGSLALLDVAAAAGKKALNAAIDAAPTEFADLTREACGTLETAILAAETLASHGITESTSFERLFEVLTSARDLVQKMDDALSSTPRTIFPNPSMACAWCERHPLDDRRSYQIHRDGAGRCSISISLVVEYL